MNFDPYLDWYERLTIYAKDVTIIRMSLKMRCTDIYSQFFRHNLPLKYIRLAKDCEKKAILQFWKIYYFCEVFFVKSFLNVASQVLIRSCVTSHLAHAWVTNKTILGSLNIRQKSKFNAHWQVSTVVCKWWRKSCIKIILFCKKKSNLLKLVTFFDRKPTVSFVVWQSVWKL